MMKMEIDDGSSHTEEIPCGLSCFDSLSVETLGCILSFCDFPSAHRFARATNRKLRETLYQDEDSFLFLWKEIFQRQCFSLPQPAAGGPSTCSLTSLDYIRATQRRRKLSRNLLLLPQNKKQQRKGKSSCFNLPNRCFFFVPITPEGHFHEWDDPPPVDCGYDSFILTSTACGSELVALDPFQGTVAVYESCLQNSVANDEAMLMDAMLKAANIIGEKTLEWDNMEEESIAGEVFEESVYRNHNMDKYKKPPYQVLFRMDDIMDPTNYFPATTDDESSVNERDEEVTEFESGFHGIDSKSIVRDGKSVGTMVAIGRIFTKEVTGAQGGRQESVCTELIAWSRWNTEVELQKHNSSRRNQPFGDRKVCRFPHYFKCVEICATHGRVYVAFENATGLVAAESDPNHYSAATVVVYPMAPFPEDELGGEKMMMQQHNKAFQEPEFIIKCQSDVTALAVDPAGNALLIGTNRGTCEVVWGIATDRHGNTQAKRLSSISIKSAISKAIQSAETTNSNVNAVVGETEGESRLRRALPTLLDRPMITSFHHPGHLSFSNCGFVTLQHSSSDGSFLLLWQKNDDSTSAHDFKIMSMINLPLSAIVRAPRVFFDGRRILVFGSDHIGMIILVYHVRSSNEDVEHFQDSRMAEETSGGVYNFTSPPKARFANRIRHVALGGLEAYDSIHMTCNERFIVVNTKTGNCLSDSACPFADGLLVIDLED